MRNSSPPNPPPGDVPGDAMSNDDYKKSVINGAKSGVLAEGVTRAMKRLCNWKSLLAMWQLGSSMPKEHGTFRAVSDIREAELVSYVERKAIIGALLAKKIITQPEWANAVIMEAQALEKYLERRFPGYRAHDDGMEIASKIAEETRRNYNFPE